MSTRQKSSSSSSASSQPVREKKSATKNKKGSDNTGGFFSFFRNLVPGGEKPLPPTSPAGSKAMDRLSFTGPDTAEDWANFDAAMHGDRKVVPTDDQESDGHENDGDDTGLGTGIASDNNESENADTVTRGTLVSDNKDSESTDVTETKASAPAAHVDQKHVVQPPAPVKDISCDTRWKSWSPATRVRFGAAWKAKVASWTDEAAAEFALRYDPRGNFRDAYYELTRQNIVSMANNNGSARWMRRRRADLKASCLAQYNTYLSGLESKMMPIRSCYTRYLILCDIVTEDLKTEADELKADQDKIKARDVFAAENEAARQKKRKSNVQIAADTEESRKKTKAALSAAPQDPSGFTAPEPGSWSFKE